MSDNHDFTHILIQLSQFWK